MNLPDLSTSIESSGSLRGTKKKKKHKYLKYKTSYSTLFVLLLLSRKSTCSVRRTHLINGIHQNSETKNRNRNKDETKNLKQTIKLQKESTIERQSNRKKILTFLFQIFLTLSVHTPCTSCTSEDFLLLSSLFFNT